MSHVLLHNHTKKSLLDSILTIEDMVKFCKENNSPSIAVTEHGNMFSFVDFYKTCTKNNIKPILGCEVYEVDNMLEKSDTKEYKQQRYHLILLVKSQIGLLNLFKIVSASYELGFYTKPRIDLKYIKENNLGEGIICLTACQIGRLSYSLTSNINKEVVKKYYDILNSIFDYTVIELQSHNTKSQIVANKSIFEFVQEYNLPFTITTDSHMAKKDQKDTQAIFVEIGEGREVGETYEDCYLQSEDDIHNVLDQYIGCDAVNQALQESLKISDMVELVDIGLNNKNQMPKIPIPEGFNSNEEFFYFLIEEGYKKRNLDLLDDEKQLEYRNRIDTEIPILIASDYIDYFIMLYMLAKEADKRGIPRGYSRGSGANCLCLYLLGVTQIDSIKWELDFSRFANLGRKSIADFDWDISKNRRKEMFEISQELFGKTKVAPICTFNSLSTKVAIRDIGKVLDAKKIYEIPYFLRDEVAKLIPTIKTLNDLGEEEEKELLLKDVLLTNDKLKKYYEQFPLWFKYVLELEGSPKSLGKHAAGVIITPNDTINYCPLCLDKDDGLMIQLEMHNAMDDLKLIKMDYLGLETLDIIDTTLKLSQLTWKDVDIDHLNLKDKNIFDYIYKQGNTIGVFQMESAEATRMCIEAETDNVEDIIVVNAANRPGTKDSFPIYCKNKKYPNEVLVLHEDLKQIFSKTHFVLLYQEQALQLFRHANFPEEQVDNARRAIGHKEKLTMEKLHDDFAKGLSLKQWNTDQIEEIWQLMLKQAEYCFNRGHSTAYALLSYLTAWLKHYYPLEFMTACLIAKTGDVSKLGRFINECNRLSIKVLPPNINESKENFICKKSNNTILFGILPIKGIGDTITKTIIENQPYDNFIDFICKSKANKDVIIALIKAGAFTVNKKKEFLNKYAESLCPIKEYENVKSLPTLKILKDKWDIEEDDKEKRLKLYNLKRKDIYDSEQKQKHDNFIKEFQEKYMQNEYMWEFETLSMFLTNNPFENAYKLVRPFDEVPDKQKAVVVCTVIDIKKKKDKNGNVFAYLDLYTPFEILESICWSGKYSEFQHLIYKGNCLAILGRKGENKLFVESIKSFEQWKKDLKID